MAQRHDQLQLGFLQKPNTVARTNARLAPQQKPDNFLFSHLLAVGYSGTEYQLCVLCYNAPNYVPQLVT